MRPVTAELIRAAHAALYANCNGSVDHRIDGIDTITVRPPAIDEEKFGKVRIVSVKPQNIDDSFKIVARSMWDTPLGPMEALSERSLRHLPTYVGTVLDWSLHEYIHGPTYNELYDYLKQSEQRRRTFSIHAANVILDLARDGVILHDVHLVMGHNVVIDRSNGSLKLYDLDSFQKTNFSVSEVIAKWMETHLYLEIFSDAVDSGIAGEIILRILTRLFKMVPELQDLVTKREKETIFMPGAVGYEQALKKCCKKIPGYRMGTSNLASGRPIIIETLMVDSKISPELFRVVAAQDLKALMKFIDDRHDRVSKKVSIFEEI